MAPLSCRCSDRSTCLTQEEIEVVKALPRRLRQPRRAQFVAGGLPGSELRWPVPETPTTNVGNDGTTGSAIRAPAEKTEDPIDAGFPA